MALDSPTASSSISRLFLFESVGILCADGATNGPTVWTVRDAGEAAALTGLVLWALSGLAVVITGGSHSRARAAWQGKVRRAVLGGLGCSWFTLTCHLAQKGASDVTGFA